MVSMNETVEIYHKVIDMYETGTKTQVDIAKALNISLEAVRWCTKFLGYSHTKAKDLKRGMCFTDDLEPLRKLL